MAQRLVEKCWHAWQVGQSGNTAQCKKCSASWKPTPSYYPAVTNKEFAENNAEFRAACDRAGVQPTKRQAARYRQKRGQAYSARKAA